jgi:4-amino-4-deoxy-L-arabinose transferase-like glycosyltransferase
VKIALLRRLFFVPSAWIGRKSEIKAAGVSEQVYWIPANIMRSLGRATVFGTIRLNENLTERFPQDVVEYVFLHERGHSNRSFARLVWFLLGVILTLLSAMLSGIFLVIFSLFAVRNLTSEVVILLGLSVCLLIIFSWLHCRIRFNEELRAEKYALNHIGENEFRQRNETIEEIINRSWWNQLRRRLFYTSVETVISEHEDE